MVAWLEFKAVAPDLVALDGRLRQIGAEFVHERRERDTYFHFVEGALMLREADDAGSQLISYTRQSQGFLQYTEADVAEVRDVREVAAMLRGRFGVRTAVEKTRRTYRWQQNTIVLDQVFGLAMFVEVRVVAGGGGRADEAADLLGVLTMLNIDAKTAETRSYATMMLEGERPEP